MLKKASSELRRGWLHSGKVMQPSSPAEQLWMVVSLNSIKKAYFELI